MHHMYISVASAPLDQPEVWGSVQSANPSVESPNPSRPFPSGSKLKYLLFENLLFLLHDTEMVYPSSAVEGYCSQLGQGNKAILLELCTGNPAFRVGKDYYYSLGRKDSV